MRFYIKRYREPFEKDLQYPCLVLSTDDWDDGFVAETLFHATYYSSTGDASFLGDIKIMTTINGVTRNVIEDEFTVLDDTYCSLWQELKFYENIRKKMSKNDYDQMFKALRDAAIHKEIGDEFKNDKVFRSSLIRFSDAVKAFKEAKTVFSGAEADKVLKFTYSCRVKNAQSDHIVDLDFENNVLPYRINAFIGKNATGKTKVLASLAGQISGIEKGQENFYPDRPSFSKVIVISYSAFDEWYKPFDEKSTDEFETEERESEESDSKKTRKDESVFFSYVYCGLRTKNGILSPSEIENNFFIAFEEVRRKDREDEWQKIMSNVLEAESLKEITKMARRNRKGTGNKGKGFSSAFSSGQNILISTMTEVIANIENDSILLFDEPEIHLHPNAIANFMRMIYDILEEFRSYAVLSTHSPLIIQEVPSKHVRVFSRIANTPIVEPLYNECFGENISTITNDVFEVREFESNYKTWFRKLAQKYSKEEIIDLFENDLSFNALTYLNSLFHNKSQQED
ncbi:AAA family ATPase [Paenibacillus favisporus]|uniref:AAA family ATPase n=1 Tax=Paenibacillus favisporus TaxID=221028 RepID=UPI003D2D39B1